MGKGDIRLQGVVWLLLGFFFPFLFKRFEIITKILKYF